MRKFNQKTLIFVLPLLLFFVPAALVLRLSKENYASIDSHIKGDKKFLIGYAYNGNNYKYLKWNSLIEKPRIEILALGSSRVLMFRKEMFDSSFYNAGYTVLSISDFMTFLKSLPPEKLPKALIIGLDQWMFTEEWETQSDKLQDLPNWEKKFDKNPTLSTLLQVYSDMMDGKFGSSLLQENLDQSKEIQKIGLGAVVNNHGFRNDGSMFYGKQIEKLMKDDSTANDYGYSDTYSRIGRGTKRFQYADKLHAPALETLTEFLDYCQSKNIDVIGFLPPFGNAVNQKMAALKKYTYIEQIYPVVSKIFEERGYEFWDTMDMSEYGSNDSETIDGFHGAEVSYLKMLIYIMENGSALDKYTSISKLKADLENRQNDYLVYAN